MPPLPELTLATLALLFAVAVLAGCIDAIAGGGGLLTIPALLSAGLPLPVAFATNKLQGTAGSLSSSIHFIRTRAVNPATFYPAVLLALLGGALGALLLLNIKPDFLKPVIPWLLIAIALYMLLAKKAGQVQQRQRLSLRTFSLLCALPIGFYDGFFGPGTGTFLAIACVATLGHPLTTATAHSKLLNFASNIASLIVFIALGQILWIPGLTMAAGQFLGAQIGARLVFKGGPQLIRILLFIMSTALALKLIIWG